MMQFKVTILFALLLTGILPQVKSQSVITEFDSIRFNKQVLLAKMLTEYEYFNKLTLNEISQGTDITTTDWFSFYENNTWHTIGGNIVDTGFIISKHIILDSLNNISESHQNSDLTKLEASGFALASANDHFQLVRDTSNLYFNSFLVWNEDQSISIWFFPAFQPSGQAIYGCEWEYVYDKTGRKLLKQNSYTQPLTTIWIGQPREIWLNYRNTDIPTLGSIFFALSFCDYFTKVRIDTHLIICSLAKDNKGDYFWKFKKK